VLSTKHKAQCARHSTQSTTQRSAAHLVWMILRNSCPLLGLKMKIAPLMGLVVRLPSKVLWMVTLCAGRGFVLLWDG